MRRGGARRRRATTGSRDRTRQRSCSAGPPSVSMYQRGAPPTGCSTLWHGHSPRRSDRRVAAGTLGPMSRDVRDPGPRPAEFKTQLDGRGGLVRVTLVGEPHDGRELFIDELDLPAEIYTTATGLRIRVVASRAQGGHGSARPWRRDPAGPPVRYVATRPGRHARAAPRRRRPRPAELAIQASAQTPTRSHGPQMANVIPRDAWMFTNSVSPSGLNVEPANSSSKRSAPRELADQAVEGDVEQLRRLRVSPRR